MIPVPESTAVATLTAAGFSILTNVLTRKFVNVKRERSMKAEVAKYKAEVKSAKQSGNLQKLKQLKKKEKAIQRMGIGGSGGRLKVTLITVAPFLILYWLVASFLGGYYVVVGYSPFPIPLLTSPVTTASGSTVAGLSFFGWYLICSFAFSGIFMRLFKTNPT